MCFDISWYPQRPHDKSSLNCEPCPAQFLKAGEGHDINASASAGFTRLLMSRSTRTPSCLIPSVWVCYPLLPVSDLTSKLFVLANFIMNSVAHHTVRILTSLFLVRCITFSNLGQHYKILKAASFRYYSAHAQRAYAQVLHSPQTKPEHKAEPLSNHYAS